MKNLKIKLPFLALLLGLGIVFVQSAFTPKTNRANTYWRYDLTNNSGLRDGDSYTKITDPDAPTCSGSNLPCVIAAPDTVTSNEELEDYLENTTTFPDDSDITAGAVHKKASL